MLDARRPMRASGYQMEQVPSSNGEFALLDSTGRHMLRVNSSVSLIWGLCDGQRPIREIVRLLVDAYPERAGEIDADVRQTLITLTEYGAIEWM